MRDKHGRYVYVEVIKDMRVLKADNFLTVIMNRELPIYLAIDILESSYGEQGNK